MLSTLHFLAIQQLPLAQAGQLLLVTGLAFGIITLICSTVRFHRLIQLSEEELTTAEDCNDFFFIQVTRYLSKISRTSPGFGLLVIQFQSNSPDLRSKQKQFLELLKKTVRKECDRTCLFQKDCVAAIIDTEEENVQIVAERIITELRPEISLIQEITAFRAGVSRFPANGLSTKELINSATDALESASFTAEHPLKTAAIPEVEEDGGTEATSELGKKDKNSSIDPLTGVLKPEAVGSYMRKYLSEIRLKKDPAAVLCIGINHIDNIISLHGERAADAVIAGVSEVLQRLTRNSDLIGRYHRDDFLILAPCSLEQGEMIALRLREAVQKEIFLFEGKRIKTSISAGIAGHPEHGRTLRDLFQASYAALSIIRQWDTATCLVYDPVKHKEAVHHE